MKRNLFILFLAMLVITTSCFLGCKLTPIESSSYSDDGGFVINEICNVTVEGGEVLLENALWEQLISVEEKEELCEFLLEEGAKVEISFSEEEKSLIFTVTSGNGKVSTHSVLIKVYNADGGFSLTSVCGVAVDNGGVVLTTAQYESLQANASENCVYAIDDGASVSISESEKVLTFEVTAVDGTVERYTVNLTVLSNATDLTVSEVGGIAVANGTVTMTKTQYNALLENLEENCVYTLAPKASVSISESEKILTFAVTAEDGTTANYTVILNVLSDEKEITVNSIAGRKVENGTLLVSHEEWLEIVAEENLEIDANVSLNAQYAVVLNKDNGKFNFTVTAEDETTAEYFVSVEIENPFGTFLNGTMGSSDLFKWDFASDSFKNNGVAKTSAYYHNGEQLKGIYSFSCDVTVNSALSSSELVLSSFVRNNKTIRMLARATSATQIAIASDYRDDGKYLNYTTHVGAFDFENNTFNMGFIVVGNDVAMTVNGEIVYHRALFGMDGAEFTLGIWGAASSMSISNIKANVTEEEVRAEYASVMQNYHDPIVGNTIGSTRSLNKCEQDFENASVRVNMLNSNSNGPMVAFYKDGVPLGGYSFALSGTIHALTKNNYSGHIYWMCYADNNNWARFCYNRRAGSAPNNSGYYRVKNNGVSYPSSGNLMYTEKNIFTDSLDYTADFTYIYDSGTVILYVENKLLCKYESNWGYATAVMEIVQYVDITYSNLSATADPLEVEKIRKQCEGSQAVENIFENENVFENKSGLSFVKESKDYATANVKYNGEALTSDTYRFDGILAIENPDEWGQGQLMIEDGNGNGARLVLEYLKDGTYQIFTERVVNGNFQEWRLLKSNVKKEMNIGIAVNGGKVTLYADKVNLYTYEITGEYTLSVGGKGCEVRIKNCSVETDSTAITEFVAGLGANAYVSPYEARANSYVTQYAGEEVGQTLLVGSSSFDYWISSRIDSNGNAVDGYLHDLQGLPDEDGDGNPDVINVGIGGSTFADWVSFYDRLVKPFAPSQIVLYCGANDVSKGTVDAAYTQFSDFMKLVRADFPEIKIIYINVMPSANLYNNNAVWAKAKEFDSKVAEYAERDVNMVVIDMFDNLCQNGAPVASLWDADNTHLNKEGYQVWAKHIRQALGLSEE